ncbi:MAG: rhodanese-like domain-containing protein [Chloroflexi bacterium]|nr:rhodanese-like domain-containing protein [Chloroflexota bacterium]
MQRFPLQEAPRIDLAEAKGLFDRGAAVFIDVRSQDAYEQAHVPGALSLPLRDLRARADELPRDRRLVLY